jgi:hypothetical protein
MKLDILMTMTAVLGERSQVTAQLISAPPIIKISCSTGVQQLRELLSVGIAVAGKVNSRGKTTQFQSMTISKNGRIWHGLEVRLEKCLLLDSHHIRYYCIQTKIKVTLQN